MILVRRARVYFAERVEAADLRKNRELTVEMQIDVEERALQVVGITHRRAQSIGFVVLRPGLLTEFTADRHIGLRAQSDVVQIVEGTRALGRIGEIAVIEVIEFERRTFAERKILRFRFTPKGQRAKHSRNQKCGEAARVLISS